MRQELASMEQPDGAPRLVDAFYPDHACVAVATTLEQGKTVVRLVMQFTAEDGHEVAISLNGYGAAAILDSLPKVINGAIDKEFELFASRLLGEQDS